MPEMVEDPLFFVIESISEEGLLTLKFNKNLL
jgi:hypothetical protein